MSISPTLPYLSFTNASSTSHSWTLKSVQKDSDNSRHSRVPGHTELQWEIKIEWIQIHLGCPAYSHQCTVPSASSLLLFPLNWCPRRSLGQEPWLGRQFKEPRLRRKGIPCVLPPHSHVPPGYLYKLFTVERKRPLWVIPCSHHGRVNQGSLCSFYHHLFPLPSLRDLAGKCMLLFILTQRQVRFFIPVQEPVQVVIQKSILGCKQKEKQWKCQAANYNQLPQQRPTGGH